LWLFELKISVGGPQDSIRLLSDLPFHALSVSSYFPVVTQAVMPQQSAASNNLRTGRATNIRSMVKIPFFDDLALAESLRLN
jgi:hypothetical protein